MAQWRSYRVPYTMGQEISLRSPSPSSTKTTEFDVKNKYKSVKEVRAEHFL